MFNKEYTKEELDKIIEKNWYYLVEKKKKLGADKYAEFMKYEVLHKQALSSPLKRHLSNETGYPESWYKMFANISKRPKENLQLLCFDKNREMISEEIIIVGEDDKVDFDFRLICQKILEHKDTEYFILNHNHPLCTGAEFSSADLDVAFYCARLGELIGVYMLDFMVVTEYDILSLRVHEKGRQRKILDYQVEGVFADRSLMLSNRELYVFTSALRNKRNKKFENEYSIVTEETSDEDIQFLSDLTETLLAKADSEKRDKIIDNIEDIVRKWKM